MAALTPSDPFSSDLLFNEKGESSPRLIREYINRVRFLSRAATQALEDDSEIIYQVIANSAGIPLLFGADTRRKARWVQEPLGEASNAFNAARNLSTLSWQRLSKTFKPVIDASGGSKTRKGAPTMDWSDA